MRYNKTNTNKGKVLSSTVMTNIENVRDKKIKRIRGYMVKSPRVQDPYGERYTWRTNG